MNKSYVEAVRNDSKVGRGSCTSIDECLSDQELWDDVISGATSEADAVRLAREDEGLFLEQGLNQRWGEDDDPQLLAWKEWNKD